MKKRLPSLIAALSVPLLVYPQWKSSDIPDSLKRNADVVIRRYATDIKVLGIDKKTITVNKVITILNEQGKDFADFSEYYDKDLKIEAVKGIIYNDLGKIIKKSKKSDFQDVSVTPDFTIYADNRMIYTKVIPSSYPFTVEYEYKLVENNILSLPSWYPQYGYRMSVENASLRVNLVDSSLIRYKTFNIPNPTIEKDDAFSKILIWEVSNLKPVEKEPYSPKAYDYLPAVLFAPVQFTYQGYKGDMQSWQNYGEWVSSLLVGRQDLSPKLVSEIQELTNPLKDIKEKVKTVYKYLQTHSRYVSIQLGIGGYQPFPASDVEKYGYGDCKALTNYTKSLLSSLGIDSYYTEIGVNTSRITFDDFPSINQTDHVFLCVPIEKDTVWLECTNQNTPFGYVSHEKQNQKVILVNGKNSRLVNTPRANAEKNVQSRVILINLDINGNANGEMVTHVFGAELENLFPEIWSGRKDQEEIIQKKYRIPSILFNDYEYKVNEEVEPVASEKILFRVNGLASITGRRFFVPSNPFIQGTTVPIKVKKRITDVVISECYTHIDTVIYSLPDGVSVESTPKPKTVTSIFGTFYSSFLVEENKVTSIRKYQQNRGKFPATEYNNLVNFLLEISNQDKQAIVVIRK